MGRRSTPPRPTPPPKINIKSVDADEICPVCPLPAEGAPGAGAQEQPPVDMEPVAQGGGGGGGGGDAAPNASPNANAPAAGGGSEGSSPSGSDAIPGGDGASGGSSGGSGGGGPGGGSGAGGGGGGSGSSSNDESGDDGEEEQAEEDQPEFTVSDYPRPRDLANGKLQEDFECEPPPPPPHALRTLCTVAKFLTLGVLSSVWNRAHPLQHRRVDAAIEPPEEG